MKKSLWMILGPVVLLSFGMLSAKQNPTPQKPKDADEVEYKPTAEDLAKKNPYPPTPEGLGEARKLFGYHCAMCHGQHGEGKGDLAEQMKLQLNDWRDPAALANRSDGELFYIVSNGKGKMLGGEGDRTTEKVRWNLVNLVRSFAKKSAGEKAKEPSS